jgi:hypothetical protein
MNISFLKSPEFKTMIVAFFTIVVIADQFLVYSNFNTFVNVIVKWTLVIAAFTLVLGATNVIMVHAKRISKKGIRQRLLSLWLLFCLAFTVIFGISSETNRSFAQVYDFFINQVFTPLTSMAFGLAGFYFVSLVFRAFRGRNRYVVVFLLAGVAILLYSAPFASNYRQVVDFGNWLLDVPNNAGTRGIVIGTAVGIVAGSLRAILGMERGVLGK